MANVHRMFVLTKFSIVLTIMLSMLSIKSVFAQAVNIGSSDRQASNQQDLTTRPLPEDSPDPSKSPRKIRRIGTAIAAPPNSVSIKSTDAGIIQRRSPTSGCSNCGIIDFINKIGQGNNLNVIASGIVAGTIAKEVIRQAPHLHGANPSIPTGGIPDNNGGTTIYPGNQYHVGVTMSDGSQAIVALPDVSHLQQGDRIQLIDGTLVVDRQ